eukprot:CAMPEP_0169479906 /NCGR_PEP_ID=MMETSP1042-20121227/29275_1 /TAXON_ID=464988 /ORGANISM="Hemiselmis andersenii, Strain CCMP1180" /LENGTH=166 /DNA_ID=CAMNT_0009594505 /DNA_START=48 /DNA_END=545 /DNA_ORIENTATION=+
MGDAGGASAATCSLKISPKSDLFSPPLALGPWRLIKAWYGMLPERSAGTSSSTGNHTLWSVGPSEASSSGSALLLTSGLTPIVYILAITSSSPCLSSPRRTHAALTSAAEGGVRERALKFAVTSRVAFFNDINGSAKWIALMRAETSSFSSATFPAPCGVFATFAA